MAIKRIDEASHKVMAKKYKKGATMQSIGDEFGITRERVRQILFYIGITGKDKKPKDNSDREARNQQRKAELKEYALSQTRKILTHEYYARPIFQGRTHAQKAVAYAIKTGELKHPSAFKCVDCGIDASEYEHRDYNKPLQVEPICRKCNANRHHAKPVDNFVAVMVSLGFAPFTYKIHMLRLAKVFNFEIQDAHLLPKRLTAEHWLKFWPELKNQD